MAMNQTDTTKPNDADDFDVEIIDKSPKELQDHEIIEVKDESPEELLEQCKKDLEDVKKKLIKTERKLQNAYNYNDDLRNEIKKLSSELHDVKNAAKQNKKDAETQTVIVFKTLQETVITEEIPKESLATGDEQSKNKPVDKLDNGKDGTTDTEKSPTAKDSTSLADDLRATAEAALQQTGYMYDEKTGLYYDYNTGYYYDAEKGMFYDPNTGTYFYYSVETGQYVFHSQVDVSHYNKEHDVAQHHRDYHDREHHGHHHDHHGNHHDHHGHHHDHSHHHGHHHHDHHHPSPKKDRDRTSHGRRHNQYDHGQGSSRIDEVSPSHKTSKGRSPTQNLEYSSRLDSTKKRTKNTKRLHTDDDQKDQQRHKKKKRDRKRKRKRRKKSARDRKSEKILSDESLRRQNSRESITELKCSEDTKVRDDSDDDVDNFELEDENFKSECYENFENVSNGSETNRGETSMQNELYEEFHDSKDDSILESSRMESDVDDLKCDNSENSTNNNTELYCPPVNKNNNKFSHYSRKHHKDTADYRSSNKVQSLHRTTYHRNSTKAVSSRKSHDRSATLHRNSTYAVSGRKLKIYRSTSSDYVKSTRDEHSECDTGSDTESSSDESSSLCTGESELESGEISSSSEEDSSSVDMQCDYEDSTVYPEEQPDDVIMAEAEIASNWPPCIRVIVTDSDVLDAGTLFIITCTGATVGREKDMGHTILIPDINISKSHAEIQFDEKEHKYFVTDLASQNGTFVNEERVSEPKKVSKPKAINHGDTLQFGCTRLLLHIHPGMDTCDECEPGQVQAHLQAQNAPQKEIVILSKEEKMRQQKDQLKMIKKKYGLKNSAYVDNIAAINNPAYTDKASERRKTVGSDNPYQPDAAPSSVHRPIAESNKGHKMLKKLGWTEGDSLGKDNEGLREPISVKFRANKSAGLGSGAAGEGSMENAGELHRRQKWLDAQLRYNKEDAGKGSSKGQDKRTLKPPQWVQGETQEN